MQMQTPQTIPILDVQKERLIEAPIEIVWESVLEQMGPDCVRMDGNPMPMVLEAWPGGRWFRDMGNNTGHFWGHVQVIKPPKLLEVCGPMFMSYPAASHMQYRLVAEGSGTRLKLVHKAIGLIDPEHAKGVNLGWEDDLKQIEKIALRRLDGTK